MESYISLSAQDPWRVHGPLSVSNGAAVWLAMCRPWSGLFVMSSLTLSLFSMLSSSYGDRNQWLLHSFIFGGFIKSVIFWCQHQTPPEEIVLDWAVIIGYVHFLPFQGLLVSCSCTIHYSTPNVLILSINVSWVYLNLVQKLLRCQNKQINSSHEPSSVNYSLSFRDVNIVLASGKLMEHYAKWRKTGMRNSPEFKQYSTCLLLSLAECMRPW